VNSGANLKVLLKDTEKLWYFGNPEARNYLSTNVAFDYDNKMELKKGLYSEDGFALIDDSNGLVLDEYGMCKERENKMIGTDNTRLGNRERRWFKNGILFLRGT